MTHTLAQKEGLSGTPASASALTRERRLRASGRLKLAPLRRAQHFAPRDAGGRRTARVCFLGGFLWLVCAGRPYAAATAQASAYIPTLTSYFQVRYTEQNEGEDLLSLRRLKVMFHGGAATGLHYNVQFIFKTNNDSSTDDRIYLQDAYIIWPTWTGVSIKAGQFVPPFGLERFQPDYDLDFVERTNVTTRLVVDGNLGHSFARDRGVEGDWNSGGWQLSGGAFDGAGANTPPRGNGPLGVGRVSYGREEGRKERNWSWRAGLAAALRRDADQDFSGQLPGLSKELTQHFRGRDIRMNTFAQGRWGPLCSQGEYFRAWFQPASGAGITARGAYAQVAWLPCGRCILALRYERFNPDVRQPNDGASRQWTAAATYDWRGVPLRIATDYSWIAAETGPDTVWRIQVQYFLAKRVDLRKLFTRS